MVQHEYARFNAVHVRAGFLAGHLSRCGMKFGIGFGNDPDDSAVFDSREALQAQRGKEDLVHKHPCHRLARDDGNRSLHARIDHKIFPGDFADHPDDAFDFSVDEIQRHHLGVGARCWRFRPSFGFVRRQRLSYRHCRPQGKQPGFDPGTT